MTDSLAGNSELVVFPDGSVESPDQQLASIPPGVGRSQVTLGPNGEDELLPYNRKRIYASIENPAGGNMVQLGLGDAIVDATSYTDELTPGELYEVPPNYVGAVRAFNSQLSNVTLRITDVTLSVD